MNGSKKITFAYVCEDFDNVFSIIVASSEDGNIIVQYQNISKLLEYCYESFNITFDVVKKYYNDRFSDFDDFKKYLTAELDIVKCEYDKKLNNFKIKCNIELFDVIIHNIDVGHYNHYYYNFPLRTSVNLAGIYDTHIKIFKNDTFYISNHVSTFSTLDYDLNFDKKPYADMHNKFYNNLYGNPFIFKNISKNKLLEEKNFTYEHIVKNEILKNNQDIINSVNKIKNNSPIINNALLINIFNKYIPEVTICQYICDYKTYFEYLDFFEGEIYQKILKKEL